MQSNTGGGHGSPQSSASQPSQRNLSDPIVRERRLAELTASMRQWQHDHLSRGYNTVMANAWHTGTAEIAVRTSSEQRRASAASAHAGRVTPRRLSQASQGAHRSMTLVNSGSPNPQQHASSSTPDTPQKRRHKVMAFLKRQ